MSEQPKISRDSVDGDGRPKDAVQPRISSDAFGLERESAAANSAGTFGMVLFLVSLSVLFIASIVGFLVVRLRAPVWPPPGSQGLPKGLWVSTFILLASSATLHAALRAVRGGRRQAVSGWLAATTFLGLAFLTSQAVNWIRLFGLEGGPKESGLYAFTFYILTGLHALHVLGGLIPLGITTFRSLAGRYTARSHAGLRYMSMYWHFLDGVWLVLFAILLIAG